MWERNSNKHVQLSTCRFYNVLAGLVGTCAPRTGISYHEQLFQGLIGRELNCCPRDTAHDIRADAPKESRDSLLPVDLHRAVPAGAVLPGLAACSVQLHPSADCISGIRDGLGE